MLTEEDKQKLKKTKQHLEDLRKDRKVYVEGDVIKLDLLKNRSVIPGRFIYELLQNAEDTEAKSISFHLDSDRMRVVHDGKKLFTDKDVDAITTYGFSSKGDEATLIGEHGIGFKSVFNVTDRPCIRSGYYHFSLKDLLVPIPKYAKDSVPYEKTEFTLPFKDGVGDKTIKECIESFIEESLLFLTHIKEIHFPCFSFSKVKQSPSNKKLKVCKVSLLKDKSGIGSYLLFEKPYQKKQKVQIAYKLGNEGQIVEPSEDLKKIFVFFPTTEASHLNLLIQAPYETISSRDNIGSNNIGRDNKEKNEKNNQITNCLATLVAESLSDLKKEGLLTWDFFKLLPLQQGGQASSDKLYCKVRGAISKKLATEALLPISTRKYAKAEECVIAGEAVHGLFQPEDLMEGKKEWIRDKDIVDDYLPRFLKDELKIETVTLQQVANKIGDWEAFLKEKDGEWFLGLYKSLYEDENAGKAFKDKPIIPLESGGFGTPKETYLPQEERESDYPVVKKDIFEQEIAKKLFQQYYKMKEPDGTTEIEAKIAPKYKEDKVGVLYGNYVRDLTKINQIWDEANDEQQKSIKEILHSVKIVRTEAEDYCKAEEVYLPVEELKTWFEGLDEPPPFVDKKIYGEFENILKELGCRGNIPIHKPSNNRVWSRQRNRYEKGLDKFSPEFSITGLKEVLGGIDLKRSVILWKILIQHHRHIKGCVLYARTQDLFAKEPKEENMLSSDGKLLDQCKEGWLYDKKGTCISKDRLSKFSPSELHADYQKSINDAPTNADKLAEQLGMSKDMMSKAEVVEKMEAQSQKHQAESAEKDKTINELRKRLREREAKDNPENPNRPDELENQPFEEISIRQSRRSIRQSGRQQPQQPRPDNLQLGGASGKSDRPQPDGYWSEKEAYTFLCDRYGKRNVEWLNKSSESKKPYDMTVKENERTIYFEVKSTEGSLPHMFEFSHHQKECAEKHGEDYRVVVVCGGKHQIGVLQSPEGFALLKPRYGLRVEENDVPNSDNSERDA